MDRFGKSSVKTRVSGSNDFTRTRWSDQSQTVQHDVRLARPAPGPVALEDKARGRIGLRVPVVVIAAHHFLDVSNVLVRPARDGHRLFVEEDLQARVSGAKPWGTGELGLRYDALSAEVGSPHVATRSQVEPPEHLWISDGSPAADEPPTHEPRGAGLARPPHNGCAQATGIFGSEFQRLREFVHAAADLNRHAAGSELPAALEGAHGVPRTLQRSEWARRGARISVAAHRRNVECDPGKGGDLRRQGDPSESDRNLQPSVDVHILLIGLSHFGRLEALITSHAR